MDRREEETVYEILRDIRDTLREMFELEKFMATMSIDDIIYYRVASTYDNPVPANTKNYKLLEFKVPEEVGEMHLYAIGSDQHDNSYYRWVVDDEDLPINGETAVGSPDNPFYFPSPIKVRRHVTLFIDNNNDKPYPNLGADPDDKVPYEGLIIGRWARFGRWMR